jgi:hypothetical protein
VVELGHHVSGGHKYGDLVLQVGGWAWGKQPHTIKELLLRNLKKGGQGPTWAVGPLDWIVELEMSTSPVCIIAYWAKFHPPPVPIIVYRKSIYQRSYFRVINLLSVRSCLMSNK